MCSQVELRRKEQLLERQSERLSTSQRVIAEQEEELAEVSKELEVTERENSRLRESMEKMLEESDLNRSRKKEAFAHKCIQMFSYFSELSFYRPKPCYAILLPR